MIPSPKNYLAVPDGSAIEHWMPAWNRLTFAAFLLATVFMVLLSVLATQGWPPPYNHFAIGLSALGPALMSFLPLLYRRKISRQWFFTTAGLILLVFLAYCNSLKSLVPMVTLKAMGLFLFTGPVAFWTGLIIFRKEKHRRTFLWMLSGVLLILLFMGWVVELGNGIHLNFSAVTYAVTFSDYHYPDFAFYRYISLEPYINEIVLTLSNPISAGSALLLLLAGPLLLIDRYSSLPLKVFLVFLLMADAGLIVVIGKKGALLALLVVVFLALFRRPRWIKNTLACLLIVGAMAWLVKPALVVGYIRGFTDSASYGLRLESWMFGFDVFLREPLLGTGFNAPLTTWLEGYPPPGNPDAFFNHMRVNNTLENMPLTMLAEMGFLFLVVYGLFLFPALRGLSRSFISSPSAFLLISCIGGFVFHSLTFDSLRNPALNWLFHSLLALLACLSASNKPSGQVVS